jgi:DNA mismatch repair protein MutS2
MNSNEPQIDDSGFLELLNARHPLLMMALENPDDAVPLNIEVGGSFNTLVISGPNTGGKTVALKTAGLLSVMALSGLHIPSSADSTVGFFSRVFADIGDEQSIEQNLSTFSSHMRQIVNVIDKADDRSLVLLDEVGAGTDPEEGSALAMSILKDLTDRGARTIASTHHGALKLFASAEKGMENGSMQFDPKTLMPTFVFTTGIPGRSNAFEIASRLGLKSDVIESARSFSSKEQKDLNTLVGEMSAKHTQLVTDLSSARDMKARVQRLAEEYERKLDEVDREKKRVRKGAAREQRRIIKDARELVEKVVEEIRKEKASRESIVEARRKLMDEALKVEEDLSERDNRGEKPARIATGMKVRISGFDTPATVVTPPDNQGRVRVLTRVGTIQIPASRIHQFDEPEVEGDSTRVSATGDHEVSASDATPLELDLRGMRVDEIQELLESKLDRVMLHGLASISIIHGKGTGALRRRVHEILSSSPHVKNFRLGEWNEGGSGVTVVELH